MVEGIQILKGIQGGRSCCVQKGPFVTSEKKKKNRGGKTRDSIKKESLRRRLQKWKRANFCTRRGAREEEKDGYKNKQQQLR